MQVDNTFSFEEMQTTILFKVQELITKGRNQAKQEIQSSIIPLMSLQNQFKEIKNEFSKLRCCQCFSFNEKIRQVKDEVHSLILRLENFDQKIIDLSIRQDDLQRSIIKLKENALTKQKLQIQSNDNLGPQFQQTIRKLKERTRLFLKGPSVKYQINDGEGSCEMESQSCLEELSKFPAHLKSQKSWVLSLDLEFQALRELVIDQSESPIDDCQCLVRGRFPNLSQLRLENDNLGNKCCFYLSKCNFPELTDLRLNDNRIGDQGCEYLSKSKLSKLSILILNNNQIGDEGCEYLAKGQFRNLQILWLGNNKIGSQGCENLMKGHLQNISSLDLRNNKIGNEGCKHIADGKFPHLQEINLSNNEIDSEGCGYLVKGQVPNLQILDLKNNKVGNQGCKLLGEGKFPCLQQLSLWNNSISDEGCEYLTNGSYSYLSKLVLNNNPIQNEEQMRQMLQQAFPSTDIYF